MPNGICRVSIRDLGPVVAWLQSNTQVRELLCQSSVVHPGRRIFIENTAIGYTQSRRRTTVLHCVRADSSYWRRKCVAESRSVDSWSVPCYGSGIQSKYLQQFP